MRKTLSNRFAKNHNGDIAADLNSEAHVLDDDFNLFSHELLLKQGKPLIYSYEALREGILELYLSVKIRSDAEIDCYDKAAFELEKL